MPSLRVVFACLLMSSAAAAGPITATVLDAETMQPIPGATIELRGTTLVADDAGRVMVGELAGPVDVTARAPGYEPMLDSLRPDAPPVILLFPTGKHEVIQIHDAPPRPSAAATTVLSRDEIRGLPGGGE